MHQQEPINQRHAHAVHKLNGCGTRPAFSTIDHDEIGIIIRLKHGFDNRHKLPRLPHAQLKADGLTTREFPQLLPKLHQFTRVGKCRMCGRRDAVFAHRDTPSVGNFLRDFLAR